MTMTLDEAHDFFMFFQSEMEEEVFRGIWGDSWEHYHVKWVASGSNVIYFWPRLDVINKMKMVKHYQKECDIALPLEN